MTEAVTATNHRATKWVGSRGGCPAMIERLI